MYTVVKILMPVHYVVLNTKTNQIQSGWTRAIDAQDVASKLNKLNRSKVKYEKRFGKTN